MAQYARKFYDRAVDSFVNVLEPKKQKPKYITPFDSKTRFAMIGPVGSGKTTIAALMLITAQTRSQDELGFKCNLVEEGSQIRESAWMLRSGRFPPKTIPTGTYAYESGLEITKKTILGEKKVHIPLIDVAGEDQQIMLARYLSPAEARNPINYLTAETLLNHLKSSEGLLLTLCAPRIPIPGMKFEAEPSGISSFPDVNISRMLQEIISYKKGRNIKGIAVVITKYDILAPYLIDKMKIDLYAPGGVEQFMHVYFPDTSMQLKHLDKSDIVSFFPSHVDLQRDEQGNPVLGPSGAPQVKVVTKDAFGNPCMKPSYSEASYMSLFDYLEGFAS